MSAPHATSRKQWTVEQQAFAQQARGLNALKLGQHIQKLQMLSGRSKRDCLQLIAGSLQDSNRRPWKEDEVDQVRELLVVHPIEVVAKKIGRSTIAIRGLCKRRDISLRDLRCDLFSITTLAAIMKVRKTEILYWIEQGWLGATVAGKNCDGPVTISPEALQRCLRVHMASIQKRNVKSATILQVMSDYCYVPKHTVGEQLLQVREAKREHAAYEAATSA